VTDRIKEYLRREVPAGLEMMIEENWLMHVFDLDSEQKYVFMMVVLPREAITALEPFLKGSRHRDGATTQPGSSAVTLV
jgi:hypothetical protein